LVGHLVKSGVLEGGQVSLEDLAVDVFDGQSVGSEHGESSEMSLQSKVNVERTSLGVHGTHEQQILEILSLFELFSVENTSVVDNIVQ
jgi:hypothetical protein